MANEYTPTVWRTGDVITAEKLNKIEEGIANASPTPSTLFDLSYTETDTYSEACSGEMEFSHAEGTFTAPFLSLTEYGTLMTETEGGYILSPLIKELNITLNDETFVVEELNPIKYRNTDKYPLSEVYDLYFSGDENNILIVINQTSEAHEQVSVSVNIPATKWYMPVQDFTAFLDMIAS